MKLVFINSKKNNKLKYKFSIFSGNRIFTSLSKLADLEKLKFLSKL